MQSALLSVLQFTIEIAHMSRNTTSKEHHKILEKFNNNQIDILIGHNYFTVIYKLSVLALLSLMKNIVLALNKRSILKPYSPKLIFLKYQQPPFLAHWEWPLVKS